MKRRKKKTLINLCKYPQWFTRAPICPFIHLKTKMFYSGLLPVYAQRAGDISLTPLHGEDISGHQSDGVNTSSPVMCLFGPGSVYTFLQEHACLLSFANPLITCADCRRSTPRPPWGRVKSQYASYFFCFTPWVCVVTMFECNSAHGTEQEEGRIVKVVAWPTDWAASAGPKRRLSFVTAGRRCMLERNARLRYNNTEACPTGHVRSGPSPFRYQGLLVPLLQMTALAPVPCPPPPVTGPMPLPSTSPSPAICFPLSAALNWIYWLRAPTEGQALVQLVVSGTGPHASKLTPRCILTIGWGTTVHRSTYYRSLASP